MTKDEKISQELAYDIDEYLKELKAYEVVYTKGDTVNGAVPVGQTCGLIDSIIDVDDIVSFLEKLKFRGDFVLQQYQFREGVGEEFKRAFSKPEHEVLVKLLTPYKNRSLPFEIFLRDEIVGYCNLNELES